MSSSNFNDTRDLIAFVFREGGLQRSSIYFYVFGSGGSRALLIFAINAAAARGGTDLWMGLAVVATVVVALWTAHMARVQGQILVEDLAKRMRRRIADRLLNADVSLMQRRDPGQIYAALTNQSNLVAGTATRVVSLMQAVILLVMCMGYMFWQSWPAGIATFVAFLLGVAAFFFAEVPARQLVHAATQARIGFYDRVNDLIHGYKELRLRRAKRDDLSEHVEKMIERARVQGIAAERIFSLGNAGAQAALYALLASIVIALPALFGADTVTVLQILTVVLFAFGPIDAVIGSLPAFARASVALRLIRDLEEDLALNAEPATVRKAGSRGGFREIELRGVTVHLTRSSAASGPSSRDSFTVGPIDLVLKPGQSVFVTGGNGMGKSTLLQVLTGLRHPDEGQILLDGVPVTRDDMGTYRELFSAVFSEFYLFKVLYGMTDEERARLAELIDELGLSDGVSVDGGAFASLSLSTGQMRRLALAAALAERHPIMVLDEFAADQDPTRRAYFYDVLVPRLAREGHLVIAVTHDEHCFDKCDRLIRMADGKIVSDRVLDDSRGIAAVAND